MTPADRVLAECVAAPDDDGPRLVWADLVGGSRGELVVVQCDLARGGLAPRETMLRRRRERELLEAHGTAWAGALADGARRWRFRRGFVESVELELRDRERAPAIAADHPLISTLALPCWDPAQAHLVPALAAAPRAIFIGSGAVADLEPRSLAGLRAFGLTRLGRDDVDALAARLPTTLQQLWLRDHRLGAPELATLAARFPTLAALELTATHTAEAHRPSLAALAAWPLRALVLGETDPRALAQLASIPTLSHLSLELLEPGEVASLAGLPLHTLELGGAATDDTLAALAALELPTLRVLHVRGEMTVDTLAAIVRRFGPQLEVLTLDHAPTVAAIRPHLVELRGGCVGEIVVLERQPWTAPNARLPHAAPTALLELAGTHVPRMPPAWFVRLDARPEIWAMPPLPVLAAFYLGRSQDAHVTLISSAVARRHARIEWWAGRHWVTDLASTNGTRLDDVLITRAPLHDGATLTMGNVVVRYFVGEGADARARAALPDVT